MNKNNLLFSLLFFFYLVSYGQVGINTDKPRGTIDFSENSGGLVLPKTQVPEIYIRTPKGGPPVVGTVVYDQERSCMRVVLPIKDTVGWSDCIGGAINGEPVIRSRSIFRTKGVGIQNNNPKGLLDLNNNDGTSDMGFIIPQVSSVKGLPVTQVGSFVFDKSGQCLKFVFKDYDSTNKWSGCMNNPFVVDLDVFDDSDEESEPSDTPSKEKKVTLMGGVGIGTKTPKGVLDASQSSSPMILPILDKAFTFKNIQTSGTLVYDKLFRAPRVVYKDDKGILHWSSHLPGANYCGYNAYNGDGKISAIKKGSVMLSTNLDNFFFNNLSGDKTLAFWAKGSSSDYGTVYGESWLHSTYMGRHYIGFGNGNLIIHYQPADNYTKKLHYEIPNVLSDIRWHYFVFEKVGAKKIAVYKDNKLLKTVDYSWASNPAKNRAMRVSFGSQRTCCSRNKNPPVNIFSGEYTLISLWDKNLNSDERVLSQYSIDTSNKHLKAAFIPIYGRHHLKNYMGGNIYHVDGHQAKIVSADDIGVPFGRSSRIFKEVSASSGDLVLTNSKTNEQFIVTPTGGSAKRVLIYETLDAPTNAETYNLNEDFFGIHIDGADNFTYNVKYKKKALRCEHILNFYRRNYHQGFSWTKTDKVKLETKEGTHIFSLANLSKDEEFVIGYQYN